MKLQYPTEGGRGIYKKLYYVRLQGRMKKSKAPTTRRANIQHLYQRYASGQATLPVCGLLRFLHKEQMELTANEETAESLIDRYEIEESGKWRESRPAHCSYLRVKKKNLLQLDIVT